MLDDCMSAPQGSAFLLHACAHNPTGVDLNKEQWAELSVAMKKQGHVVLFDNAYQGFATGNAEVDAFAVSGRRNKNRNMCKCMYCYVLGTSCREEGLCLFSGK